MGDGQKNKQNQTNQLKKISKAWLPFGAKLAVVLEGLVEDQILILSAKTSAQDVVQFVSQGNFGVRSEVVANLFRDSTNQLSTAQLAALTELGWHNPTGTPESASLVADPDGSPNHFCDIQQPVDFAVLADFAIRTLVEVFVVNHPAELEYGSFDADGNEIPLPELGLKRASDTNQANNLSQLLLAQLRETTGIDDLDFDVDGDVGGIVYHNVTVYSRLTTGEHTYARFFSILRTDVKETRKVLAWLNEVNSCNGYMHCICWRGSIIVMSDVYIEPFIVSHINHSLENFCGMADNINDKWIAEFESNSQSIVVPAESHSTH